MFKIELSRFKVKKGMSYRVDEWINFLNLNIKEVLLTLKNEKMYVENIFREKCGDDEFLYWYSIQGCGGSDLRESNFEVDKIHIQFWKECIDESYSSVDLASSVTMIQDDVKKIFCDGRA